jgi:hypothetical protein
MADGEDARLIVGLEARMDKLSAQLSKSNSMIAAWGHQVQGHVDKANSSWNKLFGQHDPGKALDSVISRSRLQLLNEAGARVNVFGAALEDLGAAGVAAGVGIVAVGAAVSQAIKAAEWAEELERSSRALGLTTSQLQLFRFWATATGIPVEKMDESLAGLNKTIGMVESGLARPLTTRAFTGLGISAEQLRSWGDLETVLPHVLEAVSKLNAPEMAAFASRLKIDPETLASLVEARGKLGGLSEEARRYGIIIDADIIKKSAEAATRLHVYGDVIDKELKVAFIELAPVVETGAERLVTIATKLAEFVRNCKDALEPIGHLIELLHQIPSFPDVGASEAVIAKGVDRAINPLSALGDIPGLAAFGAATGRADNLKRGVAALDAGAGPSAEFMAEWQETHRAKSAADIFPATGRRTRAPREPKDKSEELDDAAAKSLDEAEKALAEAYKGLTGNAQKRADFEIQAINAEADAKQQELTDQRQKILKNPKVDLAALHENELASVEVELARAAKAQLAQREAAYAIEDRQIEVHKAVVEATVAAAKQAAERLPIGAARTAAERHILELTQQLERDTQGTLLDRQLLNGQITQRQHDQQVAAIATTQGAQTAAFNAANLAPIAKWAQQQREQLGDLNTDLQTVAVEGLKDFNNGLAEAIVNGKNLGETMRGVLRQIEADLLRMALNRFESDVLGMVFGAAGGAGAGGASGAAAFAGPWADGGMVMGPGTGRSDSMLARVSNGEFIVNARAAKANAALLEQINSAQGFADGGLVGRVGRMSLAGISAVAPSPDLHFHLEGAVVTQDLLDQMNAIGRASVGVAVATSLDASRRALPGQLRSKQLLVD